MNEIVHFFAGPVIGGIIGYFTNFIAIKMLFRPRREIKIGTYVLPFTPGIIPKRKDKLARAIGETVSAKVFTEHDIEQIFLSEEMQNTVTDCIMDTLYQKGQSQSVHGLLKEVMSEDELDMLHANADSMMYHKVYQTMGRIHITERVSYECAKILRSRVKGTVVAKVLNESRITSVSEQMVLHMQGYMRENADTLILPILQQEVSDIMMQPVDELLEQMKMEQSQLREIIGNVYRKFISEYSMQIVRLFDIASLTEKKIIEFQVEEVEALVNQTIHREMQAVVNLGAVLGVIIGFVNTFL